MTEPNDLLRASPDFELSLRLEGSEFLASLQDFQREWLLNKFMNESARDLEQLGPLAKRFVRGTKRPPLPEDWDKQDVTYDGAQLVLNGHQVMQAWEHRIMAAMAAAITESHGDILEIGFGMGISATYICDAGVRSYTVVEPNGGVMNALDRWSKGYPNTPIRVLNGFWQDVAADFGQYDGVLFDPYFVADPGNVEVESSTAVGAFLPVVAPHIRDGGVMTWFTREIDSLSRAHQRMLFKYFSRFELQQINDLTPPDDCNYWWADSMVVVKAIK